MVPDYSTENRVLRHRAICSDLPGGQEEDGFCEGPLPRPLIRKGSTLQSATVVQCKAVLQYKKN